MLQFLLTILFISLSSPAYAAGQIMTYQDSGTTLEGYFVRAENVPTGGTAPIILIVHQWKGLGAYEKQRADMLAAAGYNAFAVDMYGQGVRPQTQEDAAAESSKYKNDPALARRRIMAAIETARSMSSVGPAIAVIGYCFGGTMALEAARAGAEVDAVVSFHGGLATKAEAGPRVIKADIQVHHGADDPFVLPEEVAAFEREMAAAGANLHFYSYPGAVHSFTEKEAGGDPTIGVAYNAAADQKSWQRTLEFLREKLD